MDDRPKKFCIRTRYNGEIKCIELNWDEINSDYFCKELIAAFSVKINKEFEPKMVLTDNLNMAVPLKQFESIVKTFHAGSTYYLNVEFQPTNIKGATQMVTPMMLEYYLAFKNKSMLLTFRTSTMLDGQTFHAISNELVDFAIDAYGLNGITATRKKMIPTAAVSLFPALKFKKSLGDGTEMLLQTGSQFDNRFKYLQRRQRELAARNLNEEASLECDESNPEDDLVFLKEAVIDKTDLALIKRKLNNTRALRKENMKDEKFDFRVSLPFMMSHPNLILLDFDLANPKLDPRALIDKWPLYSERLRSICQREKKYDFISTWSADIEDLLRLLKVFPSKGKGCEKLFVNAVAKFITFSVKGTAPEQMINKANVHPYIVAFGFSQREIDSFFICIEQHLFPIPKNFSVAEVLDIYFKAHIVFHSNYDPSLLNMMQFLQILIYNVTDGKKVPKPSAHMLQIFDELNDIDTF